MHALPLFPPACLRSAKERQHVMGEIQMLRQLKRGWQACSRDSSRTDSAACAAAAAGDGSCEAVCRMPTHPSVPVAAAAEVLCALCFSSGVHA